MKIDPALTPLTRPPSGPTAAEEKKQAGATNVLADRQRASYVQNALKTPEMRLARGNDSLEISAAGQALLEKSLREKDQPHDPAEAARADKAAVAENTRKAADPAAQATPGEMPNLLVAKK
ncbi:MAG: hypothetical protein ACYDIE_00620 [Candidatus Krumholzibacteriia bacterium]